MFRSSNACQAESITIRCWWKFSEWCPPTKQRATSGGVAMAWHLPTSARPLLPLTWAWWRWRWRRRSTQLQLSSGRTCRQWWLLARMDWMWSIRRGKLLCTSWPWQNNVCLCMGWEGEELGWARVMEEAGAEAEAVVQGGARVKGEVQHLQHWLLFPEIRSSCTYSLKWGQAVVFS